MYSLLSWHEIATKDVPTSIDYILNTTGKEKTIFIGFSMGTTISYVLLSKKPEYNAKISLVVSLSPIAIWKEVPILMQLGVSRLRIMEVIHF